MHAYRNKNMPEQVVVRADRDPRLDALDNWELVEDAEVPEASKIVLDRAAAERASIEEAARRRLEDAKGEARGLVNRATDSETTLEGAREPSPTAANAYPEPEPGVAALDKEHPRRKVEDTISYEEGRRRYEQALANPPTTGVLARAHADQRSGAVQIGPNPQEHPKGRAELAAANLSGGTDGGVLQRGRVATQGTDGGTEGGEAASEKDSDVPPKSAKAEDWRRFAVERRGLSQEQAAGLTKDELIERFGR